jgi:hypothetical protein
VITLKRFRRIEDAVRSAGYSPVIDWSENIRAPASADEFATAAIYVICNSGMKNSVAAPIAARCIEALNEGNPATAVFGHPGKAAAIDAIWQQRDELFERYTREYAKLDFLALIPWIGPVTKHSLGEKPRLRHGKARRPFGAAGAARRHERSDAVQEAGATD